MNDRVTVSVAIFDRMLSVIGQRPFTEVAQLMQIIQKDVKPLSTDIRPSVLNELN